MAEILIKAIDATHPDPEKDRCGCYKMGDPVVVMPDGHVWGNEECLPTFYVFKIPGLSVEQAQKYVEPHMEPRTKIIRYPARVWADAQAKGDNLEFISTPIQVGAETVTQTIKVSPEQWREMQAKGNYFPFNTVPVATQDGAEIALTGDIDYIDLQGEVMTVITRRRFRFNFLNKVPSSVLTKIKTSNWYVPDIFETDIEDKTKV